VCHSPVKPVAMKKILLILIIFSACKKEKEDTTPPALIVPFVDTWLTNRFIPFGADLSPTSINPAYEIILSDSNQNVIASCGGKVNWVRLNDNRPDFEIEISPFPNSIYRIYYDHIEDPQVSEGETIAAGDLIGRIGTGGRTELQINDIKNNRAVCPSQFGNDYFNTAFNTARTISNTNNSTSFASTCLTDFVNH
jgi:hypothetical protein